jgi:hypothetical protein
MHRGFMRLQVDEDGDSCLGGIKPSMTAMMDYEDDVEMERGMGTSLYQDGADDNTTIIASGAGDSDGFVLEQSAFTLAGPTEEWTVVSTASISSSSFSETTSIASGSFSSSSSSRSSVSSSPSSSSSRDQLDVEMRLGTGGSVPLMEYYRAIELACFSTVEPVGR